MSTEADCNYACTGNVAEICGGDGISGTLSMISLFADSTKFNGNPTPPAGPFVNPGAFGFDSVGCWTDPGSPRTLGINKNQANATVDNCLQACQGYAYAGVEYGDEW
jgi:hypothetical protein